MGCRAPGNWMLNLVVSHELVSFVWRRTCCFLLHLGVFLLYFSKLIITSDPWTMFEVHTPRRKKSADNFWLTYYSVDPYPLVSAGNWFQDPWGCPNLWMLKSLIWNGIEQWVQLVGPPHPKSQLWLWNRHDRIFIEKHLCVSEPP